MTWPRNLGFSFLMAAIILSALLSVDYVGATMHSPHEYFVIFTWTACGIYIGRVTNGWAENSVGGHHGE